MITERSPFAYLDDRARRVVDVARQRAEGLRSQVVAPEHFLLALLDMRHGLAAQAVTTLAGSVSDAENVIAQSLVPGVSPSPGHLPFTAPCKQAIARAAQQALLLGDNEIRTEHLLLGLLLDPDSPAVEALSKLGVDYDAVRAEITRDS